MRRRLVFAAKVLVTVVLCAALVRAADWRLVARHAAEMQLPPLAWALLLFIPQTLVSAWRWKLLVRPLAPIAFVESLREVLAASALNLVVPAKLGDFSKAAMLPNIPPTRRKEAGLRAVVEKLSDVGMLLVAIAFGSVAARSVAEAACAAIGILLVAVGTHVWYVVRRGSCVLLPFTLTTLLLWLLHFAQFHLFLLCCEVDVSWALTLQRIPLAIFAGLVPAAFCGIGTRDAALIYLFADSADASRLAVVGLLTALRYLIPGAVGIPILWTLRRRLPENARESPPLDRLSTPSSIPSSAVANRSPLVRPASRTIRH